MTINYLFLKLQDSKDMLSSKKDYNEMDFDNPKYKNYDSTFDSARKATEQLKVIMGTIKNFQELRAKLVEDPEIAKKLDAFRRGEI